MKVLTGTESFSIKSLNYAILTIFVSAPFLFTTGTNGSSLNNLEGSLNKNDYGTERHFYQNHRQGGEYEEKGYCAPYNGKICKSFIRGQVWYSLEDPNGGWENELVTSALWEELISDLTGQCRQAAEVCFYYK